MKGLPQAAWLLAVASVSCSGRADRPDQGSGGGGPVPASRLCSLFTVPEIEAVLGAPVGPGMVAGPKSTACQWNGIGGEGVVYAQIQVINDKRYWSNPSQIAGYEAVSAVGTEAFVVPEPGGWSAGALTDSAVVIVAVRGGKSDRGIAVKFLRTVVGKLK